MTGTTSRRRPALASLVGGVLTALGILLAATVDMTLLVLAGLGSFGPGLLRELGLLHDQDEFRRHAAWRAGYHAYLAGGFLAVLVIAALGAGTAAVGDRAASAGLVLVVMWLVWGFASVLNYWGVRKAAVRTLLVYGAFWFVFSVLANLDDPMSLLMQTLLAAPFLVLAWTATRWRRVTGVALLLCGLAAVFLFDLHRAVTERELTAALVFIAFALPLFASGLALLRREAS
jgi:hypothetical protein